MVARKKPIWIRVKHDTKDYFNHAKFLHEGHCVSSSDDIIRKEFKIKMTRTDDAIEKAIQREDSFVGLKVPMTPTNRLCIRTYANRLQI